MQRSHRRSTKVCARCRKRKSKCDFKFPACTTCKQANAICLGFDPKTREAVPRSLVRSLEARVAELEAQVLKFRAAPQNLPYLMSVKVAQATLSVETPYPGTYLGSKTSPALFFRPSCPPLAVVRDRGHDLSDIQTPPSVGDKSLGAKRHNQHIAGSLMDFRTVPFSAIQRLIQNYVDIHLPQYPCVSVTMLQDIVMRTRQEVTQDTDLSVALGSQGVSDLNHFEYFILGIVLAISGMTLTWKDDGQARSASESFFNFAVSLLLAHFAQLCPERADNWTCIANAVRIVLNLGLYIECPEALGQEQARQWRELFWVTYGMERSLCTNLRLPLSFPEETVTTKFEVPSDINSSTAAFSNIPSKKSAAHHICRYRALETEVHRVLHLEEDLELFGSTDIEDWIKDISKRLEAWYEIAKCYDKYGMLEFRHVQYNHLQARIHRPTPRLRTRAADDRQIVLNSAFILIEDYFGQNQRRRLFYPWHGVHILFETAVILLEACWSSRAWPPLRDQAEDILKVAIPRCLLLLDDIGRRWNEATMCADRLKPLVRKVTSAFTKTSSSTLVPLYEEASITEEIQGLLFADGPLTWNQAVSRDTFPVFEASYLSFADVPGADLGLFEWNPEWDIMPPEDIRGLALASPAAHQFE